MLRDVNPSDKLQEIVPKVDDPPEAHAAYMPRTARPTRSRTVFSGAASLSDVDFVAELHIAGGRPVARGDVLGRQLVEEHFDVVAGDAQVGEPLHRGGI